jgi:hypothetical protein
LASGRILYEHRADDTAVSQVFPVRRLDADSSHKVGGFGLFTVKR